MLILSSTSDLLKLVTAQAVTFDVHASWVDWNGTAATPGRTNTQGSTATTTTIVGAPGASTQRNIKQLVIRNTHSSSSLGVTVQHYDGTTTVQIASYTLAAGEQLTYTENQGFMVYDQAGGARIAGNAGRYVKTTLIQNPTTTFTTGPTTTSIRMRLVGGGGGGGGCTSVAAAAAGAGGGGSGGYLEKTVSVSPNTAYTVAVGAGGAGNSAAAGSDGGNTTVTVGATTYTANGGKGAGAATASSTLAAWPGGASPAVSTNGDVNCGGSPGEGGMTLVVAGPSVYGGDGGCSMLGSGGVGIVVPGVGNAATVGYGGGGGGSCTGASAARAGGAGANGCIVIDELT